MSAGVIVKIVPIFPLLRCKMPFRIASLRRAVKSTNARRQSSQIKSFCHATETKRQSMDGSASPPLARPSARARLSCVLPIWRQFDISLRVIHFGFGSRVFFFCHLFPPGRSRHKKRKCVPRLPSSAAASASGPRLTPSDFACDGVR